MTDEQTAEPVVETPAPEQPVAAPVVAAEAPVVEPVAEVTETVEAAPAPEENPHEALRAAVKEKARAALAAQPYRGAPAFEDLLAVADAIVDGVIDASKA